MLFSLFGCSGAPVSLGLSDGRLHPCPDSPNCVSSDADDQAHQIAPFHFDGDPARAWMALTKAVADLPRVNVVTVNDTYLHAEARSRVFRFVDDLEFHLRTGDGVIAVRSAARTGYADFGVNAERLENLRNRLRAEGIMR